MRKIECEECGRKATIGASEERSGPPMQYCRRCGSELPVDRE